MKILSAVLIGAVALAGTAVTEAQAVPAARTVVVTAAAPLFLAPDASRTPLRMAKEGSVLRLLDVQGDWYHVEFNDPEFGTRVAYVQKKYATTAQPDLKPVDLSVPSSAALRSSDMREPRTGPREARADRSPAEPGSLRSIRTVFIEKMPNDLDQYISAEISKQLKGRLVIVLTKSNADAIMRGTDEKKDGVGADITGRYLGLHDNATGSISLLDREETMVLWSSEAGDRSLMWGVLARGGQRKVADRLVSDLRKALEK